MKKSKDMCAGCRDNFYNGHNDLGIKECCSYQTAKIVSKKRVHINLMPPWNMEPIKVLSCYREKGYVMVDPKVTC